MDTTTATAKPGWKTSEFWITIAFVAVTNLVDIFRHSSNSTVGTIATVAGSALAATGYSVSRGLAKTS